MVAILILGVALAGLTHAVTTALVSSKESEVQTAATMMAASRIEQLRADGYITEGEEESLDEEGSTSPYRWKQSITRTDIDGLFDVKVTVQSAQTHKTIYELQTLLFDPPPLSTSLQQTGNQRDSRDSRSSDSSRSRERRGR